MKIDQKTVYFYAAAVFILMLAVLLVHAKTKPQDFGWPPDCKEKTIGFTPDSYCYFQLTKWFAGEDPAVMYPCKMTDNFGKEYPAYTFPACPAQLTNYIKYNQTLPSFYFPRFLYPYLSSYAYKAWHAPEAMLVLPVVSAFLALFVFIEIMKTLNITPAKQILAISLLVFWKTYYSYTLHAMIDVPFFLLLLFPTLFLLKMKERNMDYAILGGFVGVSSMMKEFAFVFLLILPIYKFLEGKFNIKKIIIFSIISAAFALVPQFLWGWNFISYMKYMYEMIPEWKIVGITPIPDKIGIMASFLTANYLIIAVIGLLHSKNKPLNNLFLAVTIGYTIGFIPTVQGINDRYLIHLSSVMMIVVAEGVDVIKKMVPLPILITILLIDGRNWIFYRILYLLNFIPFIPKPPT